MGAIVGVGNSTLHSTNSSRPSLDVLGSPSIRRQSRHAAKLNMGDTKDDIHVCIMCLRAIMNNKVSIIPNSTVDRDVWVLTVETEGEGEM